MRTYQIVDFAVSTDHRLRLKDNKTRDKYQNLARELKEMKYNGEGDTSGNWCALNNPQKD